MSTETGLSVEEKCDFLSVLKHLRELVNEAEILYCVQQQGICDNVMDIWEDLLLEDDLTVRHRITRDAMFETWPEFSGCKTHPVPSVFPGNTPIQVFRNTSNMWDGEYGAARRRLLDYMIEQLEADQ